MRRELLSVEDAGRRRVANHQGAPRAAHRHLRVVQITARQDATLEAGLVGLPVPGLVRAHQARVADDINGEDRDDSVDSRRADH